MDAGILNLPWARWLGASKYVSFSRVLANPVGGSTSQLTRHPCAASGPQPTPLLYFSPFNLEVRPPWHGLGQHLIDEPVLQVIRKTCEVLPPYVGGYVFSVEPDHHSGSSATDSRITSGWICLSRWLDRNLPVLTRAPFNPAA